MNTTSILSILALLLGVLLFTVSVTGLLWPATPVTDPGMLWTSVIFVLFGVIGFFLGRRQEALAAEAA